MTRITPDTNVLIDSPEILYNKDYSFIIPYTVLSELDGLKKNPDLRSPAQFAIKTIWAVHKDAPERITFVDIPTAFTTNDEKIVESAKRHEAKLLSNDIGANVIAEITGVPTAYEIDNSTYDKDYIGVHEIVLDYKAAANLIGISELQPEEAFAVFGPMVVNEYIYYLLPNESDKYAIWHYTRYESVVLVRQSIKPYTAAGFHFVPNDPVQACALDAVFDTSTPLTIIEGKLGTGKSAVAIVAALARTKGQNNLKVYRKIYVTRPPLPVDKSLQLGFMPGSLEDKMGHWLHGIKSNLKFLFERTKKDEENEEATKVFEDFFEPISLENIQGMNIHDSILLVDEYTLMSVDVLKQVLSRIAVGSKVVLIGDQAQTYGANRGREGYKKLAPHIKGNPLVSYVKMSNIYRSELAEFVESVFN